MWFGQLTACEFRSIE
jgi:hypothetical protein